MLKGIMLSSAVTLALLAALACAQSAQIIPYSNITQLGYHLMNMSTYSVTTLTIGNHTLKYTQNYITPTTAGITINNASYGLNVSQTIAVGGESGVYARLIHVNYVPKLHSVNLDVYQKVTTTTTTIAPTTTIAQSTTICSLPMIPAGCTWISTANATAPCAGHVACPTNTTISATTTQPTTTVQQSPQGGISSLLQRIIAAIRSFFSKL